MKDKFEEIFEKNKDVWLTNLQVTRLTYQHIIESGDPDPLSAGCVLCDLAIMIREKEYPLDMFHDPGTGYVPEKVRPALCLFCVHMSKYGEGIECMQQDTFRDIFFRTFSNPLTKEDILILKHRITRLLNIEKKMKS